MVSMPPQHGKSLLISNYFPAWILGNWPSTKIILSSYEATYAAFWGGKARDTLNNSASLFGNVIRGGQSAATGFWETNAGGYMATAGIGGPITGKGADWFIIDDPVKNAEEAASETIQAKHWEWYHSTALSRLQPKGKMILLMTRWNQNDLAGQIIQNEKGWKVINLPAICDGDNDPLGRKIGDALFPERYNIDELLRKKKDTPAYWWEAMYQGRPSPREGGMIKRSWWKYYTALPQVLRYVWSWDTAVKETQTADYSVGELWAECKDGFYLVDIVRARMAYPELKRAIIAAYNAIPASAIIVEDKSSGQQIIQELKKETRLPIVDFKTDKDKVMRLNLVSPLIESGRAFIPENKPFVFDFVEECASFPTGTHDDQVDSMTQFLLYSNRYNKAVGMWSGGGQALTIPTVRQDWE
jgi:predicted phage terminase large subunit-like protein